jgi:alkylation response protein AidB-like acyl-CoA dehydrogenase
VGWELTAGQEGVRARAAEVAAEVVAPRVARLEADRGFAADVWDAFRSADLCGVPLAEAHGGSGAGWVAFAAALAELAGASLGMSGALGVHTMAAAAIEAYGTDEQRARLLPDLSSGEAVGTLSFTERGTGSDPARIMTTATPDGDGFVLQGQKWFATNSPLAGPACIAARDEGRDGRLTAFLVDKGAPGLTIGEPIRTMGAAGLQTASIDLHGVRVGADAVLGGEEQRGNGFEVFQVGVSSGRLALAAQSLGMAARALDESIAYARQRTQLNRSIAMLPTIQTLLADMATDIEAMRQLVAWCARRRDETPQIRTEAATTKLFCATVGRQVVDRAMSVHGAYGYTTDFVVERLYRDAKLPELVEGTPEMQRVIVAQDLLWPR